MLDPRQQRVAIHRHSTNVTVIAEVPTSIPTGRPIPVRIEINSSRLRVWLHGARETVLDVADTAPESLAGFVGIRAWGAPVNVDDLTLITSAGKREVSSGASEEFRALQSLCLLLFNLNEFVYVD